jgi:rRNA maturation protein Nop10
MDAEKKAMTGKGECDCPYCDAEPGAMGSLSDLCQRCGVILKRCRSCGQPVSTLAIKCPHCGKPA